MSLYEIFGWVAVCFYVLSFQSLNPKKTVFFWIPANSLMAVHYFGLGSFTACALAFGAIFRDVVAAYGAQKYLLPTLAIFTIYIWSVFFLFGEHSYDFLITLGTTFTGLAALSRDYFWRQRCFAFVQQIILFGGFYLLGSYPAMAFIALTFGSNLIGVVRKLRDGQ